MKRGGPFIFSSTATNSLANTHFFFLRGKEEEDSVFSPSPPV